MQIPEPSPNLYDNTADSWCSGLDMEATQMAVVRAWQASQIVAIASDTQVVLTCSATDAVAIAELRQRTQWSARPLTLLYHELFRLAEDTEVDVADMLVLEARDGTSLWLTCQPDPWTSLDWSSLVPGLVRVPVVLAPGAFYQGLLKRLQSPVAVLVVPDSTAADFVLDMPDEDWPKLINRCWQHSPLRQRRIVHTAATAAAYTSTEARMQRLITDAAVPSPSSPTLLVCWDEEGSEHPYWRYQQGDLQAVDSPFAAPERMLQDAANSCFPQQDWTYPHEAAARLEAAAHRYFRQARPNREASWLPPEELPADWPTYLLQQLRTAVLAGHDTDYLAARLHISMADALGRLARREDYRSLALTGDYFLNAWLVDLLDLFWGKQLDLYYHQQLSPKP